MDTSKETVLRELISMCYDIVVEEALKSDDPMNYYINFLREISRSEHEILESEYGISMTKVKHPLTALRRYRIMNVKSYEYRFVDELKPIKVEDNKIYLKQWKCSYLHNCLKHKNPMCIRGIAMGIAIDEFSDGTLENMKVDFDEDGNCQIELDIDYDGDLCSVTNEELTLDDDIYRVITREDHLNIMIRVWVKGIEKGAVSVYGREGAVDFLQKFYSKLVEKWIEKFFKIDYYIGLPISLWTEGKFIFD